MLMEEMGKKEASGGSPAPARAAGEHPEKHVAAEIDLNDPDLYVNRELSLLAFQHRVLEEAEDDRNPLLERVTFLSILGSNLDEFFMVRVASLAAQMEAGTMDVGPDKMNPRAQLIAIRREFKKLLNEARKCLDKLMLALNHQGIHIYDHSELNEVQLRRVAKYFEETIFPVLTPLAFDPGRPFPHISNLSLNLAVTIRDRSGLERFARLKVPDSLPQLISLNAAPKAKGRRDTPPKRIDLVWLEQVIAANLPALFPGMEILEAHPFHVTRDADIAIKELEAEDLLESIEEGVKQRRFGSVIRLVVTPDMPGSMLEILMNNLEIGPADVYRHPRPLSLKRMSSLYSVDRPDLKDAPFVPAMPADFTDTAEDDDMFAVIRRRDVFL